MAKKILILFLSIFIFVGIFAGCKNTGASQSGSYENESGSISGGEGQNSGQSESASVKVAKDRIMIGTYHLSFRWCDYYGEDIDSREKQFREVVERGFFNTYFLHAQDYSKGYLMREIEIIVKNGGTFWLTLWNHHTDKETIENHKDALQPIIDAITDAGYKDYLQGMIWDEPIWNGQSNADFLEQSKLYYTHFGLRTFPVFATGEFSAIEGNLDTPGEKMGKIHPDALKYVTDVGFDSYGVDVRPFMSMGKQMFEYASWSKELDYTVKNGQDYYLGYKKLLKERVGHDVNWWYFPCAFEWGTYNGGNADEDYCEAHLEFMVEDLLKEKNQGGIALYTYYMHQTHQTAALAQHLDICDKDGNSLHFPDYQKWYDYSKLLKETKNKLDGIKAKTVDLGL